MIESELREMVNRGDYSLKFDEYRQNRSNASFYKYGPARANFGRHLLKALDSLELCLEKYRETHNTEYLCDAANYCMFEFMYPSFSDARFEATDSSGSAGVAGISVKEIESYED